MDPITLLMTRRMLLGIKARAEASAGFASRRAYGDYEAVR